MSITRSDWWDVSAGRTAVGAIGIIGIAMALFVLAASSAWAPEPIPQIGVDPGRFQVQEIQLRIFESVGAPQAGILTASGRTMYVTSRPDGIDLANANTKDEGRAWPYTDRDSRTGASPAGATDSDEECASETAELCDGAGHGPGSTNATRTQHAAEDGGGCTCSADCGDASGAVAFITSASACG